MSSTRSTKGKGKGKDHGIIESLQPSSLRNSARLVCASAAVPVTIKTPSLQGTLEPSFGAGRSSDPFQIWPGSSCSWIGGCRWIEGSRRMNDGAWILGRGWNAMGWDGMVQVETG